MEPETGKSGTWTDLTLIVLTLIWLIGTPCLSLPWIAEGLTASFGGPADNDRAMRFLVATAVVGVASPALAAIVAGKARREATACIFGAGTVLCLVAAMVMLGGNYSGGSVPPPEPLPSGYCVERSGGDNDCPGG